MNTHAVAMERRPCVYILASRRHGTLEYSSGCWWVRTLGGRPVRVGRTHVLRKGDEPVPLADGRTSLLVEGADPNDLHLVRVEVVGAATPPHRDPCSGTAPVRCHRLDPAERAPSARPTCACWGWTRSRRPALYPRAP